PAGPVLVTLDSGVFQNFNHGTEIDLKSLALCYNQNGDEGMVRDYIPEYCKSYHPDKMKELAIKQSGDTKKLKKLIKREDFNLINIIQGRNYQELKAWLDIVYDPDLSDMAIGSQSKSVIAVLPMLAHLIFDKKIKRLHFLGFNSHRQIILLALVSQYIDVTIDGSEAVNLSFKLRIMWTLLPEGRLHKTWVGNSPSPDKLRSLGGQSACNCRACQIVPLLGAYQDDKDMVASLLFMHNQSMHNQFVDLWTNWINNDSKKALEQYIRAFGGELLQCNYQKRAKLRKEFVVIKNYLELVATKGTKEAQRAYSSYL
ncbi:MAG: hypothetical protein OEL54_03340, partial [Flavobacteriaceae bacterium]|nr:hypothetical protein [Flavobacteriaceae bacterium]